MYFDNMLRVLTLFGGVASFLWAVYQWTEQQKARRSQTELEARRSLEQKKGSKHKSLFWTSNCNRTLEAVQVTAALSTLNMETRRLAGRGEAVLEPVLGRAGDSRKSRGRGGDGSIWARSVERRKVRKAGTENCLAAAIAEILPTRSGNHSTTPGESESGQTAEGWRRRAAVVWENVIAARAHFPLDTLCHARSQPAQLPVARHPTGAARHTGCCFAAQSRPVNHGNWLRRLFNDLRFPAADAALPAAPSGQTCDPYVPQAAILDLVNRTPDSLEVQPYERPTVAAEHNERDLPVRVILLMQNATIGRHHDVEGVALRSSKQITVRQAPPGQLRGMYDFMATQLTHERQRDVLVKQDAAHAGAQRR